MTGALINFSSEGWAHKARQFVPFNILTPLLSIGCFALILLNPTTAGIDMPLPMLVVFDLLVGAATALFLINCAQRVSTDAKQIPVGIGSRPMVALGKFSYSLYLIHFPLVVTCDFALRHTDLSPNVQFALLFLIAPIFCILCAYGFHRLFECPFMTSLPAKKEALQAV